MTNSLPNMGLRTFVNGSSNFTNSLIQLGKEADGDNEKFQALKSAFLEKMGILPSVYAHLILLEEEEAKYVTKTTEESNVVTIH